MCRIFLYILFMSYLNPWICNNLRAIFHWNVCNLLLVWTLKNVLKSVASFQGFHYRDTRKLLHHLQSNSQNLACKNTGDEIIVFFQFFGVMFLDSELFWYVSRNEQILQNNKRLTELALAFSELFTWTECKEDTLISLGSTANDPILGTKSRPSFLKIYKFEHYELCILPSCLSSNYICKQVKWNSRFKLKTVWSAAWN